MILTQAKFSVEKSGFAEEKESLHGEEIKSCEEN